jgi:hypothetical protein
MKAGSSRWGAYGSEHAAHQASPQHIHDKPPQVQVSKSHSPFPVIPQLPFARLRESRVNLALDRKYPARPLEDHLHIDPRRKCHSQTKGD